jgi:hypothetical protein
VDNQISIFSGEPNLFGNVVPNTQPVQILKPLSKEEKAKALCKVYQQLIDLEKKREENPVTVKVDEKWTHTHHVNGTVIKTITKTYHYFSNFSEDEYQEEQTKLLSVLDQLGAEEFMMTLQDDVETLLSIMDLVLKWGDFVGVNANAYTAASEEMNQLQQEDSQAGFQ